ncbi:MAG: phytanoyl-CoA dioxygenase family protein [Rhodospirillales bacterium]|nr:phytanoyl-CoA dioxygenase family protein [Rhodospirillales bacterium]
MERTANLARLYEEQGYLFPQPALTTEEADHYRGEVEDLLANHGETGREVLRHKGHVALAWLAELVRHPAIIEAVSHILGPDILWRTTNFFIKEPRSPGFVSWHQDATYWGLSSDEMLTAWVALSDSRPENGCMGFVPGSHQLRQVPHHDTFDPDNLLTRGQEIEVEVDPGSVVDVVLRAGEMSLHHVLMVHGSGPNASDGPRIGVAIRYMPTRIRQLAPHRNTATLVNGINTFGHFELERQPLSNMDPAQLAYKVSSKIWTMPSIWAAVMSLWRTARMVPSSKDIN